MTYRERGKARSPALEKLAAGAEKTAPAQTQLLGEGALLRRLELAAEVHADRIGCLPIVAMFVSVGALAGLVIAGSTPYMKTGEKAVVALLIGAALSFIVASFYMAEVTSKRRAAGVAKLITWEKQQPFPVTGFRDWLVNDRSVFVVHLREALEKETVLDAVRAVDPAIEATAFDDKTFELVLPSRVITGESPARYGDVKLLQTVFAKIVLPLHDDVGIEKVTMGGTIQDRV